MNLLLEKWRSFLKEEDFTTNISLERDDEGNVILYHVSNTSDIKEFDPDVAAKKPNNYTIAEYRTWDRPRVFFFTRMGQEDTGIGRIPGNAAYRVKIRPDQLYPVLEDPAQLSSKKSIQDWMIKNTPGFAEKYEQAKKCSSTEQYNQWHICSKNPDSDGLAYDKEPLSSPFFLVDSYEFMYKKPSNIYEMVARMAEEKFNSIGFIYQQDSQAGNNGENYIVAIWRKVPAEKLETNFY